MGSHADTTHPWAHRWRMPRIATSHPHRQYEVAVVVPTPGESFRYDGVLLEPTELEAEIIGSYIDYRRSAYREGYQARMLEQTFDVDDTTNTVVLAKNAQGWRFRRASFQHGLWPFPDRPDRQSEFPPTPDGLVALLDHINHDARDWVQWKRDHPIHIPDPPAQP